MGGTPNKSIDEAPRDHWTLARGSTRSGHLSLQISQEVLHQHDLSVPTRREYPFVENSRRFSRMLNGKCAGQAILHLRFRMKFASQFWMTMMRGALSPIASAKTILPVRQSTSHALPNAEVEYTVSVDPTANPLPVVT